jgi:hypothetical protein
MFQSLTEQLAFMFRSLTEPRRAAVAASAIVDVNEHVTRPRGRSRS